jgi:tetratricopeptide (TPR) repeat protein
MQKRNAELFNEALERHRQGRLDEAEARYRKLIWREPGSAAPLHALGALRLEQNRPGDAKESLARAVVLDPDSAAIRNALGAALTQLGEIPAAEAELRRAVALEPALAEAHNNLSIVLLRTNRPDEAAEQSRQAVALSPQAPELALNLGKALRDAGRAAEALAAFETAMQLAPSLAEAHFAVATMQLALGDFAAGWTEFEWRLRLPGFAATDWSKPGWQGDALDGRTILIHAEQGLGDTLQFCRYVTLVAARGGRVVLLVQPALKRILAGLDGAAEIVGFGEALPPYDLHCPLLRLPRRFQTRIETIPPPPKLAAPAADAEFWREVLGEQDGKRRIGLAWAGNPEHLNDYNRSAPLAALAPLLRLEQIDWVSLQQQVPDRDRAALLAETTLLQPGEALTDLAATAGLIDGLDLVLSVDTAVAHLAGALAKPVWVMLPYAPEWRWLGARDDSPWYPTARLFRQPRPGDWAGLADTIAAALAGQ